MPNQPLPATGIRSIVPPRAGTQSLRRAVLLLRELSTRLTHGWTLTELATQCRLDRTTTHRMLDCLIREGLVARQAGTRTYLLGPLAYELGLAAAPRYSPRPLASEVLRRLCERTGETAYLNVRSAMDTVCIERFDGRVVLKALAVKVGTRRSLVATAAGVAILLALPTAERRRTIRGCLDGLRRVEASHRAGIEQMLERSEGAGFGWNRDDIIPGVTAIAHAVLDRAGRPLGAITLAGTSDRLGGGRLARLVDALAFETDRFAQRLALDHETPP